MQSSFGRTMSSGGQAGLLRGLLPEWALVAEMDPQTADPSALLPDEAAQVARAVDKRRREFAAGRVLARRLLGELGVHGHALLAGPDRAPVWPEGIIGTITHTHNWAAVAVAAGRPGRLLGADVELDRPMKPAVADRICVAEERAWLAGMPAEEAASWAKLVFSAKESAYKAQYRRSRKLLDFSAMQISFDRAAGTFVARFEVEADPFVPGDELPGRFLVAGGWVATAVAVDSDARIRDVPRGGP